MKPRILIEIEDGSIISVISNQDVEIQILDYDLIQDGGELIHQIYSPDSLLSNDEMDNYIGKQIEDNE